MCLFVSLPYTVKPTIHLFDEKRNSVTVKVFDPPLFQRDDVRDIHLGNSFKVTCPPAGYELIIQRESMPALVRLPGLIAGSQYTVKCEMQCSSGDTLKNEEGITPTKLSRMSIYKLNWLVHLHVACETDKNN